MGRREEEDRLDTLNEKVKERMEGKGELEERMNNEGEEGERREKREGMKEKVRRRIKKD